jgi:hypothetical protein
MNLRLTGILLRVTSKFLNIFDWFFIKTQNLNQKIPQPIFIIGAPRTGSTILYQALSNMYEIAFIDNTACKWHKNLCFGMWLSNKKYADRPHNNFESDHGNTLKYGRHAPSECGAFWYRWLPKDRHFIDDSDVTQKMVKQIRTELLAISAYIGKPILFKNLNGGQRLRLIKRAFPDAKIIFVRRDPRFVVRSILRARHKVGTKPGEWWSIMPKNVTELLKLPESEMCVAQVYLLEKQIEEDLALFPDENVRLVHYQEFSESLINELGKWIGVPRRGAGEVPTFKKDGLEQLSQQELRQFDEWGEKYPFSKELFV